VAVRELATCEFELVAQSPEICPPLPPTQCNGSSVSGATVQGTYDFDGYTRDWNIDLRQVRLRQITCCINHIPLPCMLKFKS
jgi:hypothetical protein